MEEYHGIVIDVSQEDKSVFNSLKILEKKKFGGWVLYKVLVMPEEINEIINHPLIVFKERIF